MDQRFVLSDRNHNRALGELHAGGKVEEQCQDEARPERGWQQGAPDTRRGFNTAPNDTCERVEHQADACGMRAVGLDCRKHGEMIVLERGNNGS